MDVCQLIREKNINAGLAKRQKWRLEIQVSQQKYKVHNFFRPKNDTTEAFTVDDNEQDQLLYAFITMFYRNFGY